MDVVDLWDGGARGMERISFLAFSEGWSTGVLLTMAYICSGWLPRSIGTRWTFQGILSVGECAGSRSLPFIFFLCFSLFDIVILGNLVIQRPWGNL